SLLLPIYIELLVVVADIGDMWAISLKRNQCVTYPTAPDVGTLLGVLVVCGNVWCFPQSPIPNPFSPNYSADNSCRAISTRSLNVRSRIICRSTLSTL